MTKLALLFLDLLFTGGGLDINSFAPDPEAERSDGSDVFACGFCKRKLFTSRNVIVHSKARDPLDVEVQF